MTSIDLLAIVAHPDDAEIGAGGTLLRHHQMGYTTGVVDLTKGELGTRGTAETRASEAALASTKLGLSARENLGLQDGFFVQDQESIRRIIEAIRRYRPRVVITNSISDRHPDHGRAAKLVRDACFYSGLSKIETGQEAWRPAAVYHMIQDFYLKPDFVVDVSEYWERKIEVLKCYASQFFNPKSEEPETPISGREFYGFLKSRAMDIGRPAGFLLAEGFITDRPPGISDLLVLK